MSSFCCVNKAMSITKQSAYIIQSQKLSLIDFQNFHCPKFENEQSIEKVKRQFFQWRKRLDCLEMLSLLGVLALF